MPTREPVDGEIVSGQSCSQSVAGTSYPAPHMFHVRDDRKAIFRKIDDMSCQCFTNPNGWKIEKAEWSVKKHELIVY